MKIIYSPNISQWKSPPNLPYDSYISLSQNEWDDYGNRTSLNLKLVIDGINIEVDSIIKIKIENEDYTYSYLNKLISEGWSGVFPIPNTKYISLPNNILFYQALQAKLNLEEIKKILKSLHDIIYLENFDKNSASLILKDHDSFYSSLLRESGEKLAYKEGYNVIVEKNFNINDFSYSFTDKNKNIRSIKFNLNSQMLPYDINVLIGPNGVGKSHFIKELLSELLSLDLDRKFADKKEILTSFNRIIMISYSLFEEFDVDLEEHKNIFDKDAYKYFGFRKRKSDSQIGISRSTPTSDSAISFIKCVNDDIRFDYISNWVSKTRTIFEVLKKAFDFDEVCLYKKNGELINHNEIYLACMDESIEDQIDCSNGVVFRLRNKIVNLSSGQRFFSFMIINILANIKKNTLIFIDEPELFLHPILEIELMLLLKDILFRFNSKAILATHSLVIVREIPSKCVHVLKDENEVLFINHPPFETFGGDLQRISSYVFGDSSISKPFEKWLERMLEEHTAQNLIEELNSELNEEMVIKILNHGGNNV